MKASISIGLLVLLSLSCVNTGSAKEPQEAPGSSPKQAQECFQQESTTGSRISRKTCVTKEQKQRQQEEVQKFLSGAQKSVPVQGQ